MLCCSVHCTLQRGIASRACLCACPSLSWSPRLPLVRTRLGRRFSPPPPPPRGSPATTPSARGRACTCCKPRCQPRRAAVLSARLPAAAGVPARVFPAQVLPRWLPWCLCVGSQCGHRSRRAAGALVPLRLAPRRVGCTRTPPLRPPALPVLSGCIRINLTNVPHFQRF